MLLPTGHQRFIDVLHWGCGIAQLPYYVIKLRAHESRALSDGDPLCGVQGKDEFSMDIRRADLHTKRSSITEWHIPNVVLIQLILLMMGTWPPETCREQK